MHATKLANPVAGPAQRAAYRLIGQLCFNRIDVGPLPELPADAPVLCLGLHRNGALDGIPYQHAVPHAAFMVSAQLHRSTIGRFLFPGIAVARRKDRARGISADNDAGIGQCVNHLRGGGHVFVMPEGTSSLGPKHLAFKPGAARIAHEVLQVRGALTVVPFAVHYEGAREWQSRVEVVAGPAIHLHGETAGDVDDLQKLFTRALEQVGLNVGSMEELRLTEALAYGATLCSTRSYAACLKHFEAGIPEALRAAASRLEEAADTAGALRHQGIPLMASGGLMPCVALWLAMAPLVAGFLLCNLPALLAGHMAARKLADDDNVIAFWRAIVGVPAALLWATAFGALLHAIWGPVAPAAYALISVAGLKLFDRFRKLGIATFNSLFARSLQRPMVEFRNALQRSLDHA